MSNNSFRGQRYKFYVDKRQSHSFFRFYFQLDVLRGLQVSYTQLSIAKMLKKSCRLYLNGHCFFFMKQYAYLCTKMIMYSTKYLQTCLDRWGTELYWEFTRSGILQDLLQHQACCRWRTQQRTLQEVGKLGDMGISYIV